MRSLILAICAAAIFAIWASGARAETGVDGSGGVPAGFGVLVSR